ncbi:hypothetical protein NEOKW01_0878 [Nematocida sp. AWRm80]|nr:hypothetical protein NEOKW01_0878 [Nematocida sp. AWRm80]
MSKQRECVWRKKVEKSKNENMSLEERKRLDEIRKNKHSETRRLKNDLLEKRKMLRREVLEKERIKKERLENDRKAWQAYQRKQKEKKKPK